MNDERSFAELTPEEAMRLKSLRDINEFEARFIRTSMKDGLPCVAISINGVEMTVYNLDTDEADSWMNPSFNDAKRSILRRIHQLAGVAVTAGMDIDDDSNGEAYADDSFGDDGGSW